MPKVQAPYGFRDNETQEVSTGSKTRVNSFSELQWEAKNANGDKAVIVDSGTYNVTGRINASGSHTLLLIADGDVTFTFPANYRDAFLNVKLDNFAVSGFELDARADNCTFRNNVYVQDKFVLRDIELKGSLATEDREPLRPFINPIIKNKGEYSVIYNVRAPVLDGTGEYGSSGDNGNWGLWTGPENNGDIEVVESELSRSSSYGMYMAASNGQVNIRRSRFVNNNGYQVRVPSDSRVSSCLIGVDDSEEPLSGRQKSFTGVFFETKKRKHPDAPLNGGLIYDTDIIRQAWDSGTRGGVLLAASQGGIDIIDSKINTPNQDAINACTPTGGPWLFEGDKTDSNHPSYSLPPEPHRILTENSELLGRLNVRGREVTDSAEYLTRENSAGSGDGETDAPAGTELLIDGSENGGRVDYVAYINDPDENVEPGAQANLHDNTDAIERDGNAAVISGRVNQGKDTWRVPEHTLPRDITHFALKPAGGEPDAVSVSLAGEEVTESLRERPVVISFDGMELEDMGHYEAKLPAGTTAAGTTEGGATVNHEEDPTETRSAVTLKGQVLQGIDSFRVGFPTEYDSTPPKDVIQALELTGDPPVVTVNGEEVSPDDYADRGDENDRKKIPDEPPDYTEPAPDGDYTVRPVKAGELDVIRVNDENPLTDVLIDARAPGANVKILAEGSEWLIRNVGIWGASDGCVQDETLKMLKPRVSAGGTGLVESCYLPGVTDKVAEEGSAIGNCYVNYTHAGELIFRRCTFENGADNGAYASSMGQGRENDGDGVVKFEECYALNNGVGSFRLGTGGSVVTDSVAKLTKITPKDVRHPDHFGARLLWGRYNGPIDAEDSTFWIGGENDTADEEHAPIGAVQYTNGATGTLRNCTIAGSVRAKGGQGSSLDLSNSEYYGAVTGAVSNGVELDSKPEEPDPPAGAPLNAETAARGVTGREEPDAPDGDELQRRARLLREIIAFLENDPYFAGAQEVRE